MRGWELFSSDSLSARSMKSSLYRSTTHYSGFPLYFHFLWKAWPRFTLMLSTGYAQCRPQGLSKMEQYQSPIWQKSIPLLSLFCITLTSFQRNISIALEERFLETTELKNGVLHQVLQTHQKSYSSSIPTSC